MADIHLAVATPEPTPILDLYRIIKLAAIRHVLSCFLARSPMSEELSNKEFASVEEVMGVAGAIDVEGREAAIATLQSFRPGLIINRASDSSQVNVLYLHKILHQYVGGDPTLLGEIPDDPAVSQAVRKFIPVLEDTPTSEAAKSLLAVSSEVEQFIGAHNRQHVDHARQQEAKQAGSTHAQARSGAPSSLFNSEKLDASPSPLTRRTNGGADVIQNIGRAIGYV